MIGEEEACLPWVSKAMVAKVWEIIDYPYGEDADGLFF